MTPEDRELAKRRALAKARARARSNGQTMVSDVPMAQVEATSGNSTPRTEPVQGQVDQLGQLGTLDSFFDGWGGRGTAAGLQAGTSLTLGGLDRGLSWMDAVAPGGAPKLPQRDRDSLSEVRQFRQGLREKHPVSAFTGDMVGAIGAGMPLDDLIRGGTNQAIKRLPQGKEAWKKATRYGARGVGLAGEGLAQFMLWKAGAGASNKEAATQESMGAVDRAQYAVENPDELKIAAAAGPALSGVYRTGRSVITGRATPKNVQGGGASAPSLEAVQEMKSQAYKDAEALGVAYTPDAYANMVAKIENVLEQKGADPQLNASVTSMLNAMQKRVGDQPITMQTLDKVRQQVRENVISPAHRAARDGDIRLGNIIIDEIDDFIESGVGAVSNNGQAGSAAIQKARALNSVWRKSQALQDAVENATLRSASTGSGGNFENALRQEIRKIYQNPKKVAGFSEMERKAMRAVIEGDMGQNILRNIGKLSPQGNGLMAALGVGTTAANPVLAPIWLGAMGAKHLAQRGIKNKFDELDEMVREGANDLTMKNVTPHKGSSPQRGGGIKDKAVDGAALGVATVPHMAGKANAQEVDYSADLEAANESARNAEARVMELQDHLTLLEGALDPNGLIAMNPRDPAAMQQAKNVQTLLDARGFDLGQHGADGLIGPDTRSAIGSNIAEIKKEMAAQREEVEAARARVREVQELEAYQRTLGGDEGWLSKNADWLGTGLGLLIAGGSRYGGMRHSKKVARNLEDRANSLLNTNKVSGKLSPNSVNARAANLNEFWDIGGAKGKVPFKSSQKGHWSPNAKKSVEDVYKLFPKPKQVNALDLSIMGSGAFEQHMAGQYLQQAKGNLADAESRADKYRGKNQAAYEQALEDIKRERGNIRFWTGAQRFGQAAMAYGGIAALKMPYARARPNLGKAQEERALVMKHMADSKKKPKPN